MLEEKAKEKAEVAEGEGEAPVEGSPEALQEPSVEE